MLYRREKRLRRAIGGLCRFVVLALALATVSAAGTPSLAARVEPRFSVSVSPKTAEPDARVTVSFTSLDPGVAIGGCSARFAGGEPVGCQQSAGGWSARLIVPGNAKPGATFIAWGLWYVVNDPDGDVKGDANGTLPFTVLSPPRPVEPRFTVSARPKSAPPNSAITVSFTSLDAGVAIAGCNARFPAEKSVDCQQSGGDWSARLTVPGNAKPGATSIPWDLRYVVNHADGQVTGDTSGRLAFTVLSPPPPEEPRFSVSARPKSAGPNAAVTVSFTSLDAGVAIAGCTARFAGRRSVDCQQSAGGWSARLTVPGVAKPGRTSIQWALSYTLTSQGKRDARGSLPFTVLSRPTPAEPTFSVLLTPQSARPDDAVTVSFSPQDAGVVILGCTARLVGGTAVDCKRSGEHWSAGLTVPADARAGATSVTWTLSYRRGTGVGTGDAAGVLSFTVLGPDPTPPPNPDPIDASSGLGRGLLFIGLLAALALLGRRFRQSRDRSGRDASERLPAVRAAAYAGPETQPIIRNSGKGRTRVVRLKSHRPPAITLIEEVSR
jgi:hypothetical protein